jgi:formate dehydrogenase maturation protein FdhE
MTEIEAINEMNKMHPKTYKMVNGRLQGGFDDHESDKGVAFDMAVQALEKQIPQKVKNSGERIPFEWYCPTCGEVLCDDGYKDTGIKYCDQCGQKLDWKNT